MAILNHAHEFREIPYFVDQKFISPDEKVASGLPLDHEIYTYEACVLDKCTAVRVVDQDDFNAVHVVDLVWQSPL